MPAAWLAALALAAVIGTDERVGFDVSQKPWSAIGRVELHKDGRTPDVDRGSFSICSGTLVARDLVLTSAHCLLNLKDKKLRPETIWFRAGYQKSKSAGDARVLEAFLGTVTPDHHRIDDWALLRLEVPLGDIAGWLTVGSPSGDGVSLTAYGNDFAGGQRAATHARCRMLGVDAREGFLRHDCDMNGGASGGPILDTRVSPPRIIALNAGHTTCSAVCFFKRATASVSNVAVPVASFAHALRTLKRGFRLPGQSRPSSSGVAWTVYEPDVLAGRANETQVLR